MVSVCDPVGRETKLLVDHGETFHRFTQRLAAMGWSTSEHRRRWIIDHKLVPEIDYARKSYPTQQMSILTRRAVSLKELDVQHGSTLYIVNRRIDSTTRLSSVTDGKLAQAIQPDPYPALTWDRNATLTFNVQLLTADHFREVTGCDPPPTPISAGTYRQHGLPHYSDRTESKRMLGDSSVAASVTKTVGRKDEDLLF
jgi:hypothetical protein